MAINFTYKEKVTLCVMKRNVLNNNMDDNLLPLGVKSDGHLSISKCFTKLDQMEKCCSSITTRQQ